MLNKRIENNVNPKLKKGLGSRNPKGPAGMFSSRASSKAFSCLGQKHAFKISSN